MPREINNCSVCHAEAKLSSSFVIDFVKCTGCGREGHPFYDHTDAAVLFWNRENPLPDDKRYIVSG